MDPFNGIPTEIRLKILINCDRRSMLALSRASPIMHCVRQVYRVHLARKFIDKDLLGDKGLTLLAVAIALFPGPATPEHSTDFRERLYQPILRNKCPRFHDDPDLTLKIDALCLKAHHFMICQIDDHCRRFRNGTTKAINPQADMPPWEDTWIEKRQLERTPQVPVLDSQLSVDEARDLTIYGTTSTPSLDSLAAYRHIIFFRQLLQHQVEVKCRRSVSHWLLSRSRVDSHMVIYYAFLENLKNEVLEHRSSYYWNNTLASLAGKLMYWNWNMYSAVDELA